MNSSSDARARAEAELSVNPRRSDYAIAEAAHCSPSQAGHWRHSLEAAGQIPVVPVADRTPRPRLDVADDEPVNDTEIHRGAYKVGDKPSPGYYHVDDMIEWACCIAEWAGGKFTHARGCPFRRQAGR